jgi:hypothetical protein
MPTIQKELRVQIEGGQAPVLVRRVPLQVNSCEQISLFVDGVKPEPTPSAAPASTNTSDKKTAKRKKKKPQKRLMQATYTPDFKNVKFAAIYDGGQASGLRVRVGNAKFVTLEQPLMFTDGAAAKFNAKASITLENESALPRTAILLVGSDLPKRNRTSTLIRKPLRAAKAATTKKKTKAAKRTK